MTKLGLLCASAIIVGASSAHATNLAMDGFTGLSVFGAPCPLCDSLVNFAVYQNTDGDWTDDSFFSGVGRTDLADLDGRWGAAPDAAAKYVYMYQPVNIDLSTGGLDNAIRDFNITIAPLNLPLISGAGYFGGVFIDEIGNIVDANPDRDLDHPDVAVLVADVAGDRTPNRAFEGTRGLSVTNTPVYAPQAVRSGNLISSPAINSSAPHTGLIFDYGSVGIPTGSSSTTVFFASNLRPGYTWAETESAGGSGAVGDVAAPIPVPAGAALLGSALAGFGLLRYSRKEQTAA